MNNQKKILPVLLATGVALTAISGVVNAEVNPFASYEITTGYQLTDAGFKAEGRCGEGKCGANAADKQKIADKSGAPDVGFKTEGRCGEGKCGANAADKLNVADEPSGPDVGFNEQVKNQ